MNSKKNGGFKGSEPRNSSPLSSPDSESISIVDEKDKIQLKVESSLEENSSEESTASSLKRRLRDLPSPSESSPFCEGSVASSRLLRKERDFFYHLQELSNSIEEKDEAEVSSASSETRISSATGSKLQNPRIRRRVKMIEASRNQSSNFSSKLSTDSDRDSVSKSSRGSSMKTMIPKIENREDSELSQNSSRCGNSSGRKLIGSHHIDFPESDKLSSRSNLESGESYKRPLYRTDLKNDIMTSPLSPLSPLNFAGTFPILSKSSNIKISKKVGGYRPASVLLCNLSSESESDTGNDQIFQNLMIERLKTRDKLVKLQSRVQILSNPQSSIESNSSSAKFRERDFLSKKDEFLNTKENSGRVSENESKIDSDFEGIFQKQGMEKTFLSRDPVSTFSTPRKLNTDISHSFISNPTSTRSDPCEIDHRVSRIPSFIHSRINLEENSPYSAKSVTSSGRSEINFRKKNLSLSDDKKLRVPALKIRSQDLSPLGSSKEKENQQSLDMKALVSALSDVSLKRENAYGDSGKSRSDHSENRQFQTRSRSAYSKTQLSSNSRSSSLQKIPTRIPARVIASPNESTDNISQRSISTPIKIEKTRNFLSKESFPEISRFENFISTSRTEYPEVKSSRDKRSVRSFEFTSSDFKIVNDDNCFFDLKTEESSSESILNTENAFDEPISKIMEETEMHPKSFSSENHFPINEDCNLSSMNEKSENGGNNEEILSDGFYSKPSSTDSHHQEQNDLEMEISSSKKASSTFKLDPITILKTPDNFVFVSSLRDSESLKPKTSDNPHAFILPRNMKEKLFESSNQFEENSNYRKLDRLFPDLTKGKVHIQAVDEFQTRENQQMAQNQSGKEVIPGDSLINRRMFESSMGDSNQQFQGRWGYRRNNEENYPHELTEPHYQKPKIINLCNNNFNDEFEKDIKGRRVNLTEKSALFNSTKHTKSESTAILSRESTDTNLPAKSSSSMSKLTYLLESMKKENQDRYPFTISESESRNSSKFKVENEQDRTKETLPELREPEEISYNLDIHPSITRLALSGTEPLPSELISCVSYESSSQGRNFLPRMRNYIRRFSTSLKKKKSKNSKSEFTKILFKNSECRLESAGSSGDTMELQFPAEETEEAKVSSTSRGPPGNSKTETFLEHSVQRFDSEIESSRNAEVKISRAKSSPIDIKTPRPRFSCLEEPELEDFEDIRFEEKHQKPKKTLEKVKPSPEKEVSSADEIKVEVHERPSQIEAESSCFCFKLCRALVQPSVGSPGSVYLSSKTSKRSKPNPSNRKKPYFSTVDNKEIR